MPHPHASAPLAAGAHSLVIDGVRQQVRVAGQGPCCIVHAGGPGIDAGYLRMPLLERHLTMVYLDPIGTGASGRLPSHPMGYTVDRFADQVLAFVEATGLDTPFLLGHSHGAFVVLQAALKRPGATSGLILHAGAAWTGGDFMAAASAEIDRFVDRNVGTREAEEVRKAWAALPEIRSDEDYTAVLRGLLPAYVSDHRRCRDVLDVLRSQLCATMLVGDRTPFDVRDALPGLAVPTLVLAGAADFILGPRHAAILAGTLPHARLVTFGSSGHFAHLEEPDAFADAVIRFTQDPGSGLP
ncbi:proline iminopeptidase [Methylobacterium sp. ap11]|nr:proline iminopeptidase [Methylobacterium sp. ap11]